MIVEPTKITNHNRTTLELQWFWLFSLFVAGKNSDFAAGKIEALRWFMPDGAYPINWLNANGVEEYLRKAKVGQYGRLTKAIEQSKDVDLRNSTLDRLLSIHGVGPKTVRFFLLHSRKDCNCAVLDTHVLKFLRDCGYSAAPKQTPANPKKYRLLEDIFLNICRLNYPTLSVAEVDLKIWTKYSGRA